MKYLLYPPLRFLFLNIRRLLFGGSGLLYWKVTSHVSRRFGAWDRFYYPFSKWGVIKAEWRLRKYRKKNSEGKWIWKSGPADIMWVDTGPGQKLRYTYSADWIEGRHKDMRNVTHDEYFPGLTTEQAFDKLAERYYGNH